MIKTISIWLVFLGSVALQSVGLFVDGPIGLAMSIAGFVGIVSVLVVPTIRGFQ